MSFTLMDNDTLFALTFGLPALWLGLVLLSKLGSMLWKWVDDGPISVDNPLLKGLHSLLYRRRYKPKRELIAELRRDEDNFKRALTRSYVIRTSDQDKIVQRLFDSSSYELSLSESSYIIDNGIMPPKRYTAEKGDEIAFVITILAFVGPVIIQGLLFLYPLTLTLIGILAIAFIARGSRRLQKKLEAHMDGKEAHKEKESADS